VRIVDAGLAKIDCRFGDDYERESAHLTSARHYRAIAYRITNPAWSGNGAVGDRMLTGADAWQGASLIRFHFGAIGVRPAQSEPQDQVSA